MDKPREVVIHQSANRPHLLLGGDRELVLFSALLSAMLIFALVTWWGVLTGIVLWFLSVAILSRMGKADPLLRQVYLRHLRYRPFYPAKSCRARAVRSRRRGVGGKRMQITEHRTALRGVADLLLYDSMIDDGVLLLQDGALLAAWTFRGPDMASATHAEMAALSARLNTVLRLGSGWMVQCDAIRSQAPGYPETGAFPDRRDCPDRRRAAGAVHGGGGSFRKRVLPRPHVPTA